VVQGSGWCCTEVSVSMKYTEFIEQTNNYWLLKAYTSSRSMLLVRLDLSTMNTANPFLATTCLRCQMASRTQGVDRFKAYMAPASRFENTRIVHPVHWHVSCHAPQQTAIVSLYNINRLDSVVETQSVRYEPTSY
jgi:hypothetical protein